jgi:hypothetical protein
MKNVFRILLFLVCLNSVYSLEPKIAWIANGEEAKVNSLQYSQDGKYLFVHSTEREKGIKKTILRQWDIGQKKVFKEFQTKLEFARIDVSTDMKTVIGTDVSDVEVVDFENNTSKYLMINYGSMFQLITWLSFSSDNSKIFVFESGYKNIQVFNSKTLVSANEYVYKDIHRISTSFDKKYAGIISKNDTSFTFISLEDNKLIKKFKLGKPSIGAESSSISFDNNVVAINYDSTGYSNNTEIYEIATGKLITKTSTNMKTPYSVFTKDNETLAISSYPFSKLVLWNYKTQVKTELNDFVLNGANLSASPIDNSLASTTDENSFIVVDYKSNGIALQNNKDMTNLKRAGSLYISKDSKYILAAGSIKNKGVIQKRDFLTGNLLDTYTLIDNPILSMYVSKDEHLISIIDSYWTVYLLKLVDNKYVVDKQFPHETGRPAESVITSDNKKLIYGGINTGIVCWNLETGEKQVFDTTSILIKTIALSNDDSKIIYGTYASYFGVLDYDKVKDEYKRTYYNQLEYQLIGNSGITEVGFSPDNSMMYACAGDYNTYLLKSTDYSVIKTFKGVNGWRSSMVTTASITKDNSKIVVFDDYSTGRIFDIKSAAELWYDDSLGTHNGVSFNIVNSVVLSPDDKYFLVSYYEGSIALVAINDSTTSVEDMIISDEISIYPNPARDYLEINTSLEIGKIQIYSTLGLKVLETEWKERIDVSDLPQGVYFVRVGNGVSKFNKI